MSGSAIAPTTVRTENVWLPRLTRLRVPTISGLRPLLIETRTATDVLSVNTADSSYWISGAGTDILAAVRIIAMSKMYPIYSGLVQHGADEADCLSIRFSSAIARPRAGRNLSWVLRRATTPPGAVNDWLGSRELP